MNLKILVVAYSIPRPDTYACQRRFQAMLQMMARRHEICFCPLMEFKKVEPSLNAETLARYEADLTSTGVELAMPGTEAYLKVVKRRQFDLGFIEYWRPAYAAAPAFRWHQPNAGLVTDSVDLHFARELGQVKSNVLPRDVYLRNRWRELATYRSSDAVITASEPDKEHLLREGRMPPIEVIPIVMPVRAKAPRDPRSVLFVGGFAGGVGHNPNMDGILWFVKDIWPSVLARVPDAKLTVVGSNPPAEILDLEQHAGVEVPGWVPDTAPYIDQASVSIAPYRYGAGMKGKVAEALASAVPVVATSIGAQGFNANSGEHLLIADETETFAKGVLDLLTNPPRAAAIGLAGQALVASLTNPEAIGPRLENLLQSVTKTPRSLVGRLTRRLDTRMRWMAATIPRAAGEKIGMRFEA